MSKRISYETYREKLFSLLEKNNYTFTRKQAFKTLELNPNKVNDDNCFKSALRFFRRKVHNKENDYIIDNTLRTDYLLADRIPYVSYIHELKKYMFPIDHNSFCLIKDAICRTIAGRIKAFIRNIKRTLIFHPEINTVEKLEDYIINLVGISGSEVVIFLIEEFGEAIFEDLLNMDYNTFDKRIGNIKL